MLLAAALCLHLRTAPITLTLTDNVWVYPYAGDPVTDPYLRAWGSGGAAVAGKNDDPASFGYSYLKFSVEGVTTGKVTKATLTLTQIAGAGWDAADATKHPLQARALLGDFTEKKWDYDMLSKVSPDPAATSVFGAAKVGEIKEGKEITLTIDLLQGPGDFAKAFAEAQKSGKGLNIALTSSMDPGELGRAAIYKLYSRHTDKTALAPKLEIEVQ